MSKRRRRTEASSTRDQQRILDAVDELHAIEEILDCLPSIRRLVSSARPSQRDDAGDFVGLEEMVLALVRCGLARIAASLEASIG